MIGDWVYRPDCYDRVVEIRSTGIIGSDYLRGLIDYSQIEPIPLTTEILEKNGFKADEKDENMFKWNWSVIDDCISYDKSTKKVRIFYTSGLVFVKILRFVHELQHALRLCEIDKEIEL